MRTARTGFGNRADSRTVLTMGSLRARVATACVLLWAPPGEAQTIGGTVLAEGSGRPVRGAFVSLLDSSGNSVTADFTAAAGAFSLQAPHAGEYRVRIQRIGFADWIDGPWALRVGRSLSVTLEVPREPVQLGDLRVEVTGSCLEDSAHGPALATVWEEANKALQTAVWAEGRGELTFTITRYERLLEPGSLATRSAESRTYRDARLPPFESVPLDRLIDTGYATFVGDSSVYYAPDATILLSPEFRDVHCFGLRRAEIDGERLLGVTFRPRAASTVITIEGTVWLHEESAELRRVEVRYRDLPLPRGTDRRVVGAELRFDRLPDGPFYIRDWWIRFPIAVTPSRLGTFASADHSGRILVSYKQTGGTVRRAFVDGARLASANGGVTGIVRDSVSGEPLAGADIVLRDWDAAAAFLPPPDPADTPFSAVTDERGAFLVDGLSAGDYALGVDHWMLRTAGIRLNEVRVAVESDEISGMDLWTPSAETLYARICPGEPLDNGRGAVVGVTRDAATNTPVAGIEVEALWRGRRLQRMRGSVYMSDLTEGADGVSDDQGRFAICGIPGGETIRLRPKGADDAVEFTLDAQVMWRDLPAAPPSNSSLDADST